MRFPAPNGLRDGFYYLAIHRGAFEFFTEEGLARKLYDRGLTPTPDSTKIDGSITHRHISIVTSRIFPVENRKGIICT